MLRSHAHANGDKENVYNNQYYFFFTTEAGSDKHLSSRSAQTANLKFKISIERRMIQTEEVLTISKNYVVKQTPAL